MKHQYSIAVLFVTTLLSSPAFGVDCLMPGQFKNDFIFTPQIVNNSLVKKARIGVLGNEIRPRENVANPGIFGRSFVGFNGQNIELLAFAVNPVYFNTFRRIEAFARGKLFIDFKVDCGSVLNDSLTALVSFKVKRLGRLSTFSPASSTNLGVSARIRDQVENRDVDFRVIENTSVGNLLGSFRVIAKVPVPVPEVESSEGITIETFVVQLRRDRTYRFELFAGSRSTSGVPPGPSPLPPVARADFLDNFPNIANLNTTPGVELLDFSIDVAADQSTEVAALKLAVESLQQSLALLSNQILDLDESLRLQITDLENSLVNQNENITSLQDGQTQHASDISSIKDNLETLQATINDIRKNADSHTHEYFTGKSVGHNNTNATTSAPSSNSQ
jgi:uncharacterized coiled-coil protein SlyX